MSADRQALGARLRAAREADPYWSREQLARLMRAAADPGELESGTIAHVTSLARRIKAWERGEAVPAPKYRRLYARVLGVPEDELFPRSSPSVPRAIPSQGGPGASWGHESESEDDVRRRALLGLLATTAVAPWAQQAEQARAALNSALTTDATDRDADEWGQVALDYAHDVGVLPAARLLSQMLVDFAEISGVITAAAHGPVRTRLVHTAAQMAALTATALVSLGDTRSARRWWRTAARAADESGDHEAAAMVRGRQAVFTLYEDSPYPDRSPLVALSLAEEAVEAGRGRPCSGVASGYAARAQALAHLGRHEEAAAALQDLEDVFERLPDRVRDDRRSQWGWSQQRLYHVTSYVHSWAGDVDRAGRAQDQALALYPDTSYQGPTQVELHRAGCMLAAGDVEEGARHAVRVWERLPAEHRADGLLCRTAAISLGLAPAGSTDRPVLRDAYEVLAIGPGER